MNEIAKPILSEREARRLTERIRIVAHNYTEAKAKLLQLVQDAKDGNVHEVLGYASWTAYLAETLGDEPMRLARDERQEMVKVLSSEGMSRPAIAAITGASERTIQRDFKESREGETGVSPSSDPKSDAEPPAGAEWSPEAIEPGPRFTDEPGHIQPVTGTITGMDGKQYSRPQPQEPHKPKAEAITSQFSSAIVDLNRVLDRFHRISTSDNFKRNKDQVETLHGNDLARAISELQNLANQLN